MAVFASRQIVLPKMVNYVEWLQTDGNSYINTNYKPTSNTRVVCEFQMNNPSGWQALFGAADSSANTNAFAFWHTPRTGFAHYFGTNQSAEFGAITEGVGTSTQNTVDCNKNVATLSRGNKSYTVTVAAATFTCSYPIYLFGMNYGGEFKYPNAGAKIFSFDIYENDVLMQSLRPCYDPEGVACLYDKVESRYYYNAGTGAFTAG